MNWKSVSNSTHIRHNIWKFYQLEVVGRGSEKQFQVCKNEISMSWPPCTLIEYTDIYQYNQLVIIAGFSGQLRAGGGGRGAGAVVKAACLSCLLGKSEIAGSSPTLAFKLKKKMFLSRSLVKLSIVGSLCDLCLEGSVISFISPSSGCSPCPV